MDPKVPHNNPEISVIIPTYNRSKLLKRAIESVVKQSFTDFEIIIIDDCSEDDTQDFVKSIHDQRLVYFRHSKNRGGSAARNTGIKRAKGKYITFLDDDDEYTDDRLKILKDAIENQKSDYIISQMLLKMTTHRKIVPKFNPIPFDYVDLLLARVPTVYHTVLFKKEIIVHFDESLPSCQDLDFMIRIRQIAKPGFIDTTTYICNMHEVHSRIGYNVAKLQEAAKILDKKYFGPLSQLTNNERAMFFKHMADYAIDISHSISVGRNFLINSIKLYPCKSTVAIYLSTLLGSAGYNFLKKYR